MGRHRYLIALGSNMRHPAHGGPRQVIDAAIRALDHGKTQVLRASATIESDPLGPSRRRYANSAVVVRSKYEPQDMLARLHKIERRFGRRRCGASWRARVLDLDIILWSGGAYTGSTMGADLLIPHPEFRARRFVLDPAVKIAREWRDPLTRLTVAHLRARHMKASPRQALAPPRRGYFLL